MRWFKRKRKVDNRYDTKRELGEIAGSLEKLVSSIPERLDNARLYARCLAYLDELGTRNPRYFSSQIHGILSTSAYGHAQLFELIRALSMQVIEYRQEIDRLEAEVRELKGQ